MVKRLLLFLTGLTAAVYGLHPAAVAAAQPIGNAWKLCDQQSSRVEMVKGIPVRLLKAISLAETGRWDRDRQANVAWPWTVTALGKGNYFPDKKTALEYVRFLQANAITNIDVGYMQINLYYHGGAFDSLEQAIDPAANVTYAAKYLAGLYKSTRSWTRAAGFYHSTTPERAKNYKMKVLKYWNAERRSASRKDRKAIDRTRMVQLNASHKAQKKAALGTDNSKVRGSQLAAWRSNSSRNLDMATLAAMRRASKVAQWREKYHGSPDENGEDFTKKRQQQLEKWRLTKASKG